MHEPQGTVLALWARPAEMYMQGRCQEGAAQATPTRVPLRSSSACFSFSEELPPARRQLHSLRWTDQISLAFLHIIDVRDEKCASLRQMDSEVIPWMGIRVVKYYLISRRFWIMVILGPRGGWNGRRGATPRQKPVVNDDGRDEPEFSDHWLSDLGEHGGNLAIGRATLVRDLLPDAPDA